ncbi:hypothetical protein Cgig2_022896 [Carnegiea gigantea]|uniref:Uncharacterized protein n=1 Tax=Carnegiea gigantea TaxID=171969 RepID=A0A9Q1KR37_9CARY|nr:hypothetical protein Cgig2_022896 [Carnegiea gigantea]
MTTFTLQRLRCPRLTLGTSTTKKSTSRFLAFSLLSKRIGKQIMPVWFTSCPPKPKMGCTKGTMSRPGYVSFWRQSQVMMSTELSVSIRILRAMMLATFISTTRRSLCGEAKRTTCLSPNTMTRSCLPRILQRWWPQLSQYTLHPAAGAMRALILRGGSADPSLENRQSDPYPLVREGLFQLVALRSGVPVRLMKFVILSCIVGLRGSSGGLSRLALDKVATRPGSDCSVPIVVLRMRPTIQVRSGDLLVPLSMMGGWCVCMPVGRLATCSGHIIKVRERPRRVRGLHGPLALL